MIISNFFENIKKKILNRENLNSLIVILVAFFLDRYSKTQILNNYNDRVYYINEFLNLELVWNTGVGFGLLSFDSNLYYNLISLLIFVVIIFLSIIIFKSNKYDKLIFSMIVGGALGNFYDRIFYYAVPDFIDLHYNNFHWFTFNVADIFISAGIIAFLVKDFFIKTEV